MTEPSEKNGLPAGRGIGARYFPRSRISQGLISVAPWVDAVLLIILFVLMDARVVVQPGIQVDLPPTTLGTGMSPAMVAIVLSVRTEGGREREEIVFFDDERFLVKSEEQMQNLKQAFALHKAGKSSPALVIKADKEVFHGTMTRLMVMAQDVGISQVHIAARTD